MVTRVLSLIVLLSACGEAPRDVGYAGRRSAPALTEPVRSKSAGERFGAGKPVSEGQPQGPPLAWSAPKGWVELAPTQMRIVNFKVGDEGECYLTILGGDGGGISGNVNRWRGQLGLGDLSDSEVEALPKMSVLGREASIVDLRGSYTGMGVDAKEGWALLGAITTSSRFTLFVKFIGPEPLLKSEAAGFEAFCSSLVLTTDTGDTSAASRAEAVAGSGDAGGFSWDVPARWVPEPGSGMRLVTFRIGEVECYVVVLGGNGGGIVGNIQRWVGQLGLELPSEADVAAMPLVEVLGVQAPLLEATGSYTGMGSAQAVENTTMLGLPCLISGRAVFVKMLGPKDEVAAQRDNFLSFAGSLTLDGGGQ
jgi:hypothetical protein